ncbi:type II toxin-antitoxin system VapC family toxin [Runella sp.]|uniref:type II toxin-antitoxin system VapC family toxin n=1 Tax=Runella sp. TaxID=1960881 RepID=UPI003D0E1833
MGKGYLIDTNVFVKYIQEQLSEKGSELVDTIFDANDCRISIINWIELLSWQTDQQTQKLVEDFIEIANEYELSEMIANKTIIIRRQFKIKLPDAVIAATAMVHELILLLDNDRDFGKIAHLSYINPTKL